MRLLCSLFFLVILGTAGHCERPLKVGLIVQPPFVIKNDLSYNGLAVDLWNEMAQGLKRSYEFVECPTHNLCEPFDTLQKGDIDVLLGPISITMDRYEKVDFTFPFFRYWFAQRPMNRIYYKTLKRFYAEIRRMSKRCRKYFSALRSLPRPRYWIIFKT